MAEVKEGGKRNESYNITSVGFVSVKAEGQESCCPRWSSLLHSAITHRNFLTKFQGQDVFLPERQNGSFHITFKNDT